MNDRDVEAKPGDNDQSKFDGRAHELPADQTSLSMPRQADVSRSNQARPWRPWRRSGAPAESAGSAQRAARSLAQKGRAASSGRLVAQAHPIDEPVSAEQARPSTAPAATPLRLSAPHPRSRVRSERRSLGRSLGLGRLAALRSVSLRPEAGWARPRVRLGRPSLRTGFGIAGLTCTVAVVAALLVALPSHPVVAPSTGSIYGISWHKAATPPFAKLDFGPHFTTLDNELLMLGTAGSTTTVWATSDGSNWTQRSVSGSFGTGTRRFVAQGLADDGQGGLVAVGNSLGSTATDVTATAWHSRDGTTWTQMAVDSAAGQEMIAGVASRPGAAVTAGNGVAWLSTDGISWSAEILPGAVTSTGSYTPRAVGSWNGGFVIVGLWNGTGTTRSTAWYSPNGVEWTQAKTSLDGFDVAGIAGLDGTIVAVGSDLSPTAPGLAASWSSTDGSTWTKTTAPSDLTTVQMDGVARVGDSLIAFGAPPASTANSAASPGPTLSGSTPQPVAAEVIWVTEDGLTWLPLTNASAPLYRAHMASIGSLVVMIGGSSGNVGTIGGNLVLGPSRPPASKSPAPANFALTVDVGNTPMISDVTKDFTLGPVANSKDRFYVFATGPTGTSIFSSPNGSLWSQEAGPDDLTASGVTGRPVVLQAIPDGKGGIVAIGKITNSSGNNGMIWHMTTAGKWSQAQFQDDAPPEFSSITSGAGLYIVSTDVAGGSPIMYSTDGETWQAGSIAVGDGFALTVANYRYGYVAVGTDPKRQGATTAWTSPDGRTWTLRTDWKLPANVTALFGMGNSLVAAARTAVPASSASPSAKPTPTPAVAVNSTTWWWSATGVVWQQSGLKTSGGDWAIVNNELLVINPPAKLPGTWSSWNSADGLNWHRLTSNTISFAGSATCTIASNGSQIVVVGWEGPGALKDYLGRFASN
jgi:hypothetical protein